MMIILRKQEMTCVKTATFEENLERKKNVPHLSLLNMYL
jgi:hypothetical protein